MTPPPLPRILVLGHDGQIGWELQRRLQDSATVQGLSYPEIDFARGAELREHIRLIKPDIIINAAGYTAVDLAESEPDLARTVNAEGPQILAEEAARLDALLIHYSTDFVFDGSREAAYTEEDEPHPLSVYGITKRDGDLAILSSDCRHLIFRVTWIYGLRGKNFLLTMQRLAETHDELRVVNDQIGSPTWCAAVAAATVKALDTVTGPQPRLDAAQVSGLYNMVCSGRTSWHGFARAILPPEIKVTPIPTADYPTPAQRPPAPSAHTSGRPKP